MFLDHSHLEELVAQVTDQLRKNFSGDWLRYPGVDVPTVSVDRSAMAQQITPHRSMLFEFFYCLEGTVYLELEQQLLQLQAGQLCLIPAGSMHVELSDRQHTGTSLFFVFLNDGVWINRASSSENGTFDLCFGQCIALDPILSNLTLRDIAKELHQPQLGSDTMIKCGILQLLTDISRTIKKQTHKMTAEEWKRSVVKDVIACLKNDPGNPAALTELSERCAMSTNHLNSIFRSVTGKTINAYCSELRLQEARRLLETTDIKLRQLADMLGFYDQYHFCKTFKKATGMSPSQYRQAKKR